MATGDTLNIIKSNDPAVFADCALLMSRSDPWTILGLPYEYCKKAFEGDFREVFMAQYDHELAGFVIMQTQGTFKGYIQTIFMKESWRGRGLGRKLIQFCENRILKYSPNIFICVSSFNSGAAKLYEELGYKRVGELEDFLKKGYSELLYRKTVGPIVGYI
jgi:[ribosomal protein S18]-alanine N-acetyltransferase